MKQKTLFVLKVILAFGITLTLLYFLQVNALASDYKFDANYYARKYPDVVTVLGSDPTVLANHYNTSGQYEGRFACQAEESYYDSIHQFKPKSQPSTTQQQVVKPTPVVETNT